MLRVGTSGWQYADWRSVLYPPGLPQRAWLSHYSQSFDTVEVNAAFYRLPSYETFERWRDTVPYGFVMAVKASRYLTHVKRLADPAEPVSRLMRAASGLGDRLGPVLLQLPPTLRGDAELLDACLAEFPRGVRLAVEPRHETWWTDDVRRVLEKRGAALCWADRDGRAITPLWRTTGWGYLRLHHGRTDWAYGRTALRRWHERLEEAYQPHEDVYVYFNNDPGGAAVRNAQSLLRMSAAATV